MPIIICVEQLPTTQRFILDHGGKLAIRAAGHAAWAADPARVTKILVDCR